MNSPQTSQTYIHTLRVIYAHTDKMQVVYYGRYFEFMEAARNEFLRNIGFEYAKLEPLGVMLPVIEAHAVYLAPARYDDELEIHTTISKLENVRVSISYRIFEKISQKLLLTGNTVLAFVTPTGKPTRLPKEFLEKIQPYVG
ncbi:MAG: thioesterase family protein [Chloroherpetonaceae bacterium]|nr:thioesterase family protein [Chloroherpetonaceae bacterium]